MRIVTSKTWTRESTSKETCSMISRTACSKPALSSSICREYGFRFLLGMFCWTERRDRTGKVSSESTTVKR